MKYEELSNKEKHDRFLEAFARIERALGSYDPVKFTRDRFYKSLNKSNNPVVKEHKNILSSFGDFRNCLSHNHDLANCFAYPDINVLREIERLAEFVCPQQKILDIAVPIQKIFSANLQSSSKDVAEVMTKNSYTHVPVLDEDNKLIGVFSEGTLLNFYGSSDETIVDRQTNLEEFAGFLLIENRPNEEFIFVSRDKLLVEVKDLFTKAFTENIRLGAVFVTHDGKPTQKILGMVTAWDMFN